MPEFDLKESTVQIKRFAIKVQRRLQAAGAASHSLEDVEQELWIAWCNACRTFDPKMGAAFSTYLHRGMQLHINRYVDNNVTKRHEEVVALSLDFDPTGDGETTLQDVIPSGEPTPEDEVHGRKLFASTMDRLSSRSRAFLTILNDQPPAVLDAVRQLEAKSLHAKCNGQTMPVSRRLTASMIFDLMDASRGERRAILNEIEDVVASIGQ